MRRYSARVFISSSRRRGTGRGGPPNFGSRDSTTSSTTVEAVVDVKKPFSNKEEVDEQQHHEQQHHEQQQRASSAMSLESVTDKALSFDENEIEKVEEEEEEEESPISSPETQQRELTPLTPQSLTGILESLKVSEDEEDGDELAGDDNEEKVLSFNEMLEEQEHQISRSSSIESVTEKMPSSEEKKEDKEEVKEDNDKEKEEELKEVNEEEKDAEKEKEEETKEPEGLPIPTIESLAVANEGGDHHQHRGSRGRGRAGRAAGRGRRNYGDRGGPGSGPRRRNSVCYNCGDPGHFARSCPGQSSSRPQYNNRARGPRYSRAGRPMLTHASPVYTVFE